MSLTLSQLTTNKISDLGCAVNFDSTCSRQSLLNVDLTSVFLFLSSHVGSGVEGFISNISLGSSFGWYFRVDQFELIFLSLLMLQIFILRWIEILPVNMNNLFIGDPSGRKRRKRSVNLGIGKIICRRDELADSMFRLLRKLDDGECFPFALCELGFLLNSGKHVPVGFSIPRETRILIDALKMSSDYRKKYPDECDSDNALKKFEEAVTLSENRELLNDTICENRYHSCPLNSQDVSHHLRVLAEADLLGNE